MNKVKIKLDNGDIIKRVPKVTSFGNFVILTAMYKNKEYIINEGDEYLNGYPEFFRLGKELSKHE